MTPQPVDLVAPEESDLMVDEEALALPLPGGGWRLWRSVLLRGAGFPAHEVARLSSPSLAASADRLLDLEEDAARLRAQVLREVNERLDRLRQDGLWDDKAQRRPLLKAVQALTAGKLPAEAPDPATLGALREADARLREYRQEVETELEKEQVRFSREMATVAGSAAFREAVTWQN
ncbi:MAG TPA: hypothetical protein VFH51_00340, partial [Myxococcota bacterium]|nr:hypothetical protein [Myxococcota bacterium]